MGFLLEKLGELDDTFCDICSLLVNEEIASSEEYEELVEKFKGKMKEAISMAEYLY